MICGTGSKRRTGTAIRRAALTLQPLEQREVPAALTAVLSGAQLTVTGTDAADSIVVRQDAHGRMFVNGAPIRNAQSGAVSTSVPAAQVSSVVVEARGGNDTVWLVDVGGAGTETDRSRAINVSAGGGNDFVGMGLGRNVVSGGNGADDLEGYVSGSAYTVTGGAGDDVIDRVASPLSRSLRSDRKGFCCVGPPTYVLG